MSYAHDHYYHRRTGARVPFAEFTDSFKAAGEAAYEAFDATKRFFESVAETAVRRHRERVTFEELSGLADHVLRDIGVSRSEIGYIAKRVAADPDYDHRTANR